MENGWNERAGLADDAYHDHLRNHSITVHGVNYKILDAVNSSPTGFQATAYQRVDNGNIEIEFRGTEAFGDWLRDDRVDFQMVKSRVDAQLPEADAFTRQVLAKAKMLEPQYGHSLQVSLAGHSLGAVPAEVLAFRYKLPGEAFNGYGSVDLAYDVPEGQPKDAPPFINHVKATDIVSAASRHYGTVVAYATEQDVEALRQGRYLDAPDPRHPANPMITGKLGAHFISNFAPGPGKGESILTAANEARYEQHRDAFEHFRHDVLTSRVAVHGLLNDINPLANKAHLGSQLDDAIDVTRYKLAVSVLEHVTGLDDAKTRLDGFADFTQWAGTLAQAQVEETAADIHAADQTLDGATRTASHMVSDAGRAWHQAGDKTASVATQLQPAAPFAAGALALGSSVAGLLGERVTNDLASKVGAAGSQFHHASAWASEELHTASDTLHMSTAWASCRWREMGDRVQHATDAIASTQAYDAMRNPMRGPPRLDEPGHPDYAMFQQAWHKVRQIDAERGRVSDQCSANLAGALVPACKAQGITRIDAVTLSDDGSRAFASEHLLGRTVQRHAVVDTTQAVHTPLEQSSAQAASMATAGASADVATQARQQAAPPLQR